MARVTLNTTCVPSAREATVKHNTSKNPRSLNVWPRKERLCRAPTCLLHAQYDTLQREPILSFNEATTFVTHGWIAGVSLVSPFRTPGSWHASISVRLCQSNSMKTPDMLVIGRPFVFCRCRIVRTQIENARATPKAPLHSQDTLRNESTTRPVRNAAQQGSSIGIGGHLELSPALRCQS